MSQEWQYTFLRGGAANTFLEAALDFDIAKWEDGKTPSRPQVVIYHVVAATPL